MIQIGNAAARLPFGLGRLFSTSGPEVPASIDSQVYPMVDIDSARPERAFIQGERIYADESDQTGGAGQNAGIALTIAAGNLVAVVIERIRIQAVATVPQFVVLYTGNIASPGVGHNATQRDSRITGQPTAILGGGVNVAAPPQNLQGSFLLQNVGDSVTIDMPYIITSPAAQTNGVLLLHQTNAARMIVNMWWRERPLSPSELIV